MSTGTEAVFVDSDPNDWMLEVKKHLDQWKESFSRDGYLIVPEILPKDWLEGYNSIYERMLSGEIDTTTHRHDLGSYADSNKKLQSEHITQIMWPSDYVTSLRASPLYQRSERLAKWLLGEDVEFDFDHLIAKAAGSEASTPWHSDESYWPDMPDKRAVTFWVPMDDAIVDNGCMWFVPASHLKQMRPHRPVKPNAHALMCDCSESEGVSAPLLAGGCTLHMGRTLHYTRGNSTSRDRRTFILVYRPRLMITWIRERGYDHGRKGMKACLLKSQDNFSKEEAFQEK